MRWSAFLFLEEGRTFILRGRHREKTILARTFESGSVGDYLDSLARLRCFDLQVLYPGHGRISTTPMDDIDRAMANAQQILDGRAEGTGDLLSKDRGKLIV
jgi:glyoxylase-like metal-dependent hydrolase (beta-lactamase superfamily II)